MGFSKRSFCQDSADRYNYTFTVWLLLAMFLVTWLLPLSPYLQQQHMANQPTSKPATVPDHVATPTSKIGVPKFKLDCWCPAQFRSFHVAYTNAVCGAAFDRAMQGLNETSSAKLYELDLDPPIPGGSNGDRITFKPNMTATRQSENAQRSESDKDDDLSETSDPKKSERRVAAWYFIRVTVPFSLFVFAVVIKAPQLVYVLCVSCFGAMNIDKTLESTRTVKSSRQERRELALVTARQSGNVAALMYLLLKFLACASAIVCLLVVSQVLLPRATRLEKDVVVSPAVVEVSNLTSSGIKEGIDSNVEVEEVADVGTALICEFNILQMTNMKQYSVQCIISLDNEGKQVKTPKTNPAIVANPKIVGVERPSELSPRVPIYEVYETILLCVQTLFIVLSILNVSSFIIWAGKLFACPKSILGGVGTSLGSIPLDAVLLMQMAHENVGPDVVADFADVLSGVGKITNEEQERLEEAKC